MSFHIKDKNGKEYEIMTRREAEGRSEKLKQFNSVTEARIFVEDIMATPEGPAQLRRLFVELQAAKTNHRHSMGRFNLGYPGHNSSGIKSHRMMPCVQSAIFLQPPSDMPV